MLAQVLENIELAIHTGFVQSGRCQLSMQPLDDAQQAAIKCYHLDRRPAAQLGAAAGAQFVLLATLTGARIERRAMPNGAGVGHLAGIELWLEIISTQNGEVLGTEEIAVGALEEVYVGYSGDAVHDLPLSATPSDALIDTILELPQAITHFAAKHLWWVQPRLRQLMRSVVQLQTA